MLKFLKMLNREQKIIVNIFILGLLFFFFCIIVAIFSNKNPIYNTFIEVLLLIGTILICGTVIFNSIFINNK